MIEDAKPTFKNSLLNYLSLRRRSKKTRRAVYDAVARQLTPQRLRAEFGSLLTGSIVRYELPTLNGFNFVMDEALEGGVNLSLNLDGHGKSWSSLLLGLQAHTPGQALHRDHLWPVARGAHPQSC